MKFMKAASLKLRGLFGIEELPSSTRNRVDDWDARPPLRHAYSGGLVEINESIR